MCKHHIKVHARHGSPWCPTYLAADIKPYLKITSAWVEGHTDLITRMHATTWLSGLLEGAGRAEPATIIKRWSAKQRAQVAFARLREAGIKPDRILAIHIAINALIDDDRGAHDTREFRVVQVAKALHRLASGTHQRWEVDGYGRKGVIKHDVYPKSTGRVLRVMGERVAEACADVASAALDDVIRRKAALYGPHPSHLPGWLPHWARQRAQAA